MATVPPVVRRCLQHPGGGRLPARSRCASTGSHLQELFLGLVIDLSFYGGLCTAAKTVIANLEKMAMDVQQLQQSKKPEEAEALQGELEKACDVFLEDYRHFHAIKRPSLKVWACIALVVEYRVHGAGVVSMTWVAKGGGGVRVGPESGGRISSKISPPPPYKRGLAGGVNTCWPTPPPPHIRKLFLRENEIIQEARHSRPILAAQTSF